MIPSPLPRSPHLTRENSLANRLRGICIIVVALSLLLTTGLASFRLSPSPAPTYLRSESVYLLLSPSEATPSTVAVPDSEIDNLQFSPIDPALEPEQILRSRPFVLGSASADAFPAERRVPSIMTEDHARDRLRRFLYQRNLERDVVDQAVAQFDDPVVKQTVPAPTLRASLLMLTAWDPYQVSIEAILGGNNLSGKPFLSVDFGQINVEDAVATVETTADGEMRMIINKTFEHEPPEQFIPVIVHESLHGGGVNSQQEEVIANILDAISYSEVLLIDPRVATFGTDLTIYNNVEVLALLNSVGRAGGGQIGISSSPLNDVFVGPNLSDFNAESIRAIIEADDFYATLPKEGSPAPATLRVMLDRFPKSVDLGPDPDFSSATLAVIDDGVGQIITPEHAVTLALLLGLEMTTGILETPLPVSPPSDLSQRPFIPFSPQFFDRNQAQPTHSTMTKQEARAALTTILNQHGISENNQAQLLQRYDSTSIENRIPDPSLRAAVLLLGANPIWQQSMAAIIEGNNSTERPLAVAFADLDGSRLIARGTVENQPAILINSWLEGESIDLLASYLVEGTFLSDDTPTENAAIISCLFGTLAYTDMVRANPNLAHAQTWGTIERNRYTLALINSAPQENDGTFIAPAAVGLFNAANNTVDILPGLYANATSFADFVRTQIPSTGFSADQTKIAGPIVDKFLGLANNSYVPPEDGTQLSPETMAIFDKSMAVFFDNRDALAIADILQLGTAFP